MPLETIVFWTGKPGSGKSYSAVFESHNLLKLGQIKKVITNLPYNSSFPLLHKVEIIDVEKFMQSAMNPEWLSKENLNGALIIIDEFHLLCPRTGNVEQRRWWRQFLAEVRHHGAVFWALTQSTEQLDREVFKLAPVRYEIINKAVIRSFVLGIPYGPIYDLVWALTGMPHTVFRRSEYVYTTKWISTGRTDVVADLEVFDWYCSRSAAYGSGKDSLDYIKPSVWTAVKGLWRYRFTFLWRFVLLLFVLWLVFGGGAKLFFGKMVRVFPVSQNSERQKTDLGANVKDVPKKNEPDRPINDTESKFLLSELARSQGLMLIGNDLELSRDYEFLAVQSLIPALRLPYYVIGRFVIERQDRQSLDVSERGRFDLFKL